MINHRIESDHDLYKSNDPYPWICYHNFMARALPMFPHDSWPHWNKIKGDPGWSGSKRSCSDSSVILEDCMEVIRYFNSDPFIAQLEALTGIPNLLPDPHLLGGGLHQTLAGGKLAIHVDFNKHSGYNLDRRLNLILFLGESQGPEDGGEFEIWDKKGKTCAHAITPLRNTCVIFSTIPGSYHGQPNPTKVTRNSIALYYYTNGRPQDEVRVRHSTMWKGKRSLKDIIKAFIPPIAYDIQNKFVKD